MKFTWKKLGKIFDPTISGCGGWMLSHAQCPTPLLLDQDTLRIYFATRPACEANGLNVARVGFVDLDAETLLEIKRVSAEPALGLGECGMFDEFGVMPGSVVRCADRILLYYTGWTRMRSVPYSTAIGLAESTDGGETFHRIGKGPALGLSMHAPLLINSPIVKQVNNTWHMWCVSGSRWIDTPNGSEIECHQAYAVSDNGIDWVLRRTNITCSNANDECQDQLSPLQIGENWHAFFSVRNAVGFRSEKEKSYRLAYATSPDLETWNRHETSDCLQRSENGWDSDMISSTTLFEHRGRRLMLYCGNKFGREGFGLAELFVD